MSDFRITFVFLCLYTLYLALGAILFHAIECPEEIREKTLLTAQRERFLELIQDVGESEMVKVLEACTLKYYHPVCDKISGVNEQQMEMEKNADNTCDRWSFFNSMLKLTLNSWVLADRVFTLLWLIFGLSFFHMMNSFFITKIIKSSDMLRENSSDGVKRDVATQTRASKLTRRNSAPAIVMCHHDAVWASWERISLGTIHKGRPYPRGGGGGWPKSRHSEGGCVNLVLNIT